MDNLATNKRAYCLFNLSSATVSPVVYAKFFKDFISKLLSLATYKSTYSQYLSPESIPGRKRQNKKRGSQLFSAHFSDDARLHRLYIALVESTIKSMHSKAFKKQQDIHFQIIAQMYDHWCNSKF